MKESRPEELAELLYNSLTAVALTGAGISVDSGIPSFRGASGLWTRYDPLEYAHIQAFLSQPVKVWKMLLEMAEIIRRARPNPAHYALAELEQLGKLAAVITQNVDNLHQAAGSRQVIEYHGNARRYLCVLCRRRFREEELDFSQLPLFCPCGGLIKPDIVFFGEEIPQEANRSAFNLAETCDLLLVVGTSASVMPASYLPYVAKNHGAIIVEVNPEKTPLTQRLTDYFLPGKASEILVPTVAHLKARLS